MTAETFVWSYQEGAIARTDTLHDLINVMKKSVYAVPNIDKMTATLERGEVFKYGIDQFSVKKEIH